MYSLICIVTGSTLATLLPRKSTYQGTPFEFTWMPYGYVFMLGVGTTFISPVCGTRRPTMPDWMVKNSVPF